MYLSVPLSLHPYLHYNYFLSFSVFTTCLFMKRSKLLSFYECLSTLDRLHFEKLISTLFTKREKIPIYFITTQKVTYLKIKD